MEEAYPQELSYDLGKEQRMLDPFVELVKEAVSTESSAVDIKKRIVRLVGNFHSMAAELCEVYRRSVQKRPVQRIALTRNYSAHPSTANIWVSLETLN